MFIGFRGFLYWGFSNIHRVDPLNKKAENLLRRFSEIGNLGRLQLKLELVSNKGDKFGIRGFSLGIAFFVGQCTDASSGL